MKYGGLEVVESYGIYLNKHGMYYEKYYPLEYIAEREAKQVAKTYGDCDVHKGWKVIDSDTKHDVLNTNMFYKSVPDALFDMREAALNNYKLRPEIVSILSQQLPRGTKVEAIEIMDPVKTVSPGTTGEVLTVNNAGLVYVNWDDGTRTFILHGQDEYKVVKP